MHLFITQKFPDPNAPTNQPHLPFAYDSTVPIALNHLSRSITLLKSPLEWVSATLSSSVNFRVLAPIYVVSSISYADLSDARSHPCNRDTNFIHGEDSHRCGTVTDAFQEFITLHARPLRPVQLWGYTRAYTGWSYYNGLRADNPWSITTVECDTPTNTYPRSIKPAPLWRSNLWEDPARSIEIGLLACGRELSGIMRSSFGEIVFLENWGWYVFNPAKIYNSERRSETLNL